MSQILCAKSTTLPSAALRLSILGVLSLAAVALGNTGCEDKAIGRPCDVLGNSQPAYASFSPTGDTVAVSVGGPGHVELHATSDGLVHEILCVEGQAVSAGQPLVLVR